ncbi:MAG: hypothetical protein R2747_00595 [Pyrinomonadaceae bacterium]
MLAFLRYAAGDVLLILLGLFLMFSIPLIIGGVVFFVLRRNRKNRAAWQEISRQLDLPMKNPNQLQMAGLYNDCEVKLSVGARRSGGENSSTEFFTYCTVRFPHSLRFLLNIAAPKGLFSKIFDSNRMILGQSGFDQRFNAKCYDQEVLRRLLLSDFPSDATQNLMGDLMMSSDLIDVIEISDEKVYLETGGQVADFERLKKMLDTTTYLAKRFYSARQSFPLAEWERQTLRDWRSLADEQNLRVDERNFELSGTYGSFPVRVRLLTDRGKWQTGIELKFTDSLMTGLRIMPENSIHKAFTWLGAQDIEAGDKAFDDAFIVKAKNVAVARSFLTPDFCRQMVGLKSQTSGISVTDEEMVLTFDTVLGDRRTLKSHLEALASTARMLRR